MNEGVPQVPEKPRRIESSETEEFSREGFDGHVYVAEPTLGFNALAVDVHGRHPRKKMLGDTTRSYFVIEGHGVFVLGNESYNAGAGDLFIVPPGAEYEYEGEMRLFEFNVSPSKNIQDEKI